MTSKNTSSRGRQDIIGNSNKKNQNSKRSTSTSKDKNFRIHPHKLKNYKVKSSPFETSKESDETRLNKYIANSGICSRREADKYIKSGSATVNGKVITEMGFKVKPDDEVRFDGALISPESKRYVLLNKPKNYITTMDDDRGRKTVMELIQTASKERIYPVGRLDRNTTGLLLLTNDGDLTKKLSHPSHNVQKIYQVELNKPLKEIDLKKIKSGVKLEDGLAKVDFVNHVENKSKNIIQIEIHMGKNRIVRRIFEHFNYEVIRLDRIIYAGLTKKDLPRGWFRPLNKKEIIMLKHFI